MSKALSFDLRVRVLPGLLRARQPWRRGPRPAPQLMKLGIADVAPNSTSQSGV